MSEITISIKGIKEALEALNINLEDQIDEAITAIALELDNLALDNLQERIYSKPQSRHYKRTGAAQQGRIIKSESRGKRVIYNPQLKGASKNYAPMLNKNRRIFSLHTLFWDDAVLETNKNLIKIIKKYIGFKK